MKRTAAIAIATLSLLATACPSSPPPKPTAISTSRQAMAYIESARLTRSLLIDGGKLRLDPVKGTPALSERRALDLWLARGSISDQMYGKLAGDVAIVYARASISIPINPAFASTIVSPRIPHFARRPVWAIMWLFEGPAVCTANPPINGIRPAPSARHTPSAVPPRFTTVVELIDANGGDGVFYVRAGRIPSCGGVVTTPAFAKLATYQVSVPWRLGSTHGRVTNYVVQSVPCSIDDGGGGNGRDEVGFNRTVLMVSPPCPGDQAEVAESLNRPRGSPSLTKARHATTGLVGLSEERVTYFDGKSRTLIVRMAA